MSKNNTLLYVGAAGVLAYLYLSSQNQTPVATSTATTSAALVPGLAASSAPITTGSSVVSVPTSSLTAGASTVPLTAICPGLPVATYGSIMVPYPPTAFSKTYFLEYQYPALTKNNPDLLNSGYQLTNAELNQYAANYLDIAEGVPTWTSNGGNYMKNLQYHWTQFGVAQQRSFDPFLPSSEQPYVPPPVVAKAKSSSSFLGDVADVAKVAAPIVAAVAGTGDNVPDLTSAGVEVIANGAAIAKDILPMFYQVDLQAVLIDQQIDDTLTYYLA